MKFRVGFEMTYQCPQPTPMILALNIHYSRASDLVRPDHLLTNPSVPVAAYRDLFGNWCSRLVAPKGRFTLTTDRGWICGTTTVLLSASNAAFGGATPAPLAFFDTVFQRAALGATPYVARTVTLTFGPLSFIIEANQMGPATSGLAGSALSVHEFAMSRASRWSSFAWAESSIAGSAAALQPTRNARSTQPMALRIPTQQQARGHSPTS